MNKQEFIANLRAMLWDLPEKEAQERISFYIEMIDDRIEEGLSEEEAVLQVGSVDVIAAQIKADTPFRKISEEKIKQKKNLGALEIVLLVLGSPIWLSLAVAAFAVIFSLYAVLWSVIVSLWSAFASLVACALLGVFAGSAFALVVSLPSGIAIIGVGLVLVGISIFFFFGCKALTKGLVLLTKKIALYVKKCFVKKENA